METLAAFIRTPARKVRFQIPRARSADGDLTGADLTRADLTRVELTGALWQQGWPVPAGWTRHTGSGQLIPADASAEKAAAHQSHG
jgi:hypothetical protein